MNWVLMNLKYENVKENKHMPGVCGFDGLGVRANALSRDVRDVPPVAKVDGAGTSFCAPADFAHPTPNL